MYTIYFLAAQKLHQNDFLNPGLTLVRKLLVKHQKTKNFCKETKTYMRSLEPNMRRLRHKNI